VVRNGGKYTPCHSTFSDEQSHPNFAATVKSVSMSAGRSTLSSDLPLHLREHKNVHYDGGVPWMLIPDDEGVLHIAILTEISPPVTINVATDVRLNLYTKYVRFVSRSSELKLNGCPVWTRYVTKTPQTLVGVAVNIQYGYLPNTSNMFRPACSVLPTAGTSVNKVTVHLAACL
jgi:hypothetical protein